MVIQSQDESQPLYSNPGPWVVYLVGIGSPSRVCILVLPHLLYTQFYSNSQLPEVQNPSAFASGLWGVTLSLPSVKGPPLIMLYWRFTLVRSLRYYTVLENPLLQAWDLIFGCSCVIRLCWSPAQEDLVSLLYSQTLPHDLVRAHLLTLLRSCLCHKPSTWLLLIIMPTRPRLLCHHLPYLEVWWLNWRYFMAGTTIYGDSLYRNLYIIPICYVELGIEILSIFYVNKTFIRQFLHKI